MRERYAVSLSFEGQLLKFLLRKAKLELPLADTIDIFLEKANLLSIWMTRYLASGTPFRISPIEFMDF